MNILTPTVFSSRIFKDNKKMEHFAEIFYFNSINSIGSYNLNDCIRLVRLQTCSTILYFLSK